MDRSNIEKDRPHDGGEKCFSKLWDKIQTGVRRTFPLPPAFSPQRAASAKFLFGDLPGLFAFGGYAMRSGKC